MKSVKALSITVGICLLLAASPSYADYCKVFGSSKKSNPFHFVHHACEVMKTATSYGGQLPGIASAAGNLVSSFQNMASSLGSIWGATNPLTTAIPNLFHGIAGGLSSGMFGSAGHKPKSNSGALQAGASDSGSSGNTAQVGNAHIQSKQITSAMNTHLATESQKTQLNTTNLNQYYQDQHANTAAFTDNSNLSFQNLIGSASHSPDQAAAAMSFTQLIAPAPRQALPATLTKDPTPAVQAELFKRRAAAAKISVGQHVFHSAVSKRQPIAGLGSAGGVPDDKDSNGNKKSGTASQLEILQKQCDRIADLSLTNKMSQLPIPVVGKVFKELDSMGKFMVHLSCEESIHTLQMSMMLGSLAVQLAPLADRLSDIVGDVESGHPEKLLGDLIKLGK